MAIEDLNDKQSLANFIEEQLGRLRVVRGAVVKFVAGGSGVVAYGTKTLTWAGGTTDATAAVTHGLSAAPVNIQLTADSTGAVIHDTRYESVGAQTFTIRAIATAAPGAGTTIGISWWAAI